MTAMITTTQYIERYSAAELEALTDRDSTGTTDSNFFARWAREATAIIEEYLGAQPDPLPEALVGIAAALTRWHLHLNDKPEAVQAGYDSAITRLKAMRDGQTVLPPETLNESLPEFASRPRELW
jgi:phage gp36-like protein